jgi:hypothetical protein
MSVATALVGNTDLLEPGLGFEPVGRAAMLLLFDGLNQEIETQQERWSEQDLKLQELTSGTVGQIDIEPIEGDHFFEGPHRSLVDAAPSAYPNVSVMGYSTQPKVTQYDQFDSMNMRLMVEVMVKAGPVPEGQEVDFETILHRRIQRTTEAVHIVVSSDRTLLGTVEPIQLPPRGGIAQQSWARREEKGRGPRYLWQGSRLEYALERQSA